MNYISQLTKTLDEYYAKAPVLPTNIKELLVSFAPWLALLGGVFALLSGFSLFGLLGLATSVMPYAVAAGVGGFAITAILSLVVLLVAGVIDLLAFAPLKAKKVKGWNLMLYAMLIYVLSSVVTLRPFDVVSALVGFLIGYYFLYQVKSYYK
jgi:hypothetical protein